MDFLPSQKRFFNDLPIEVLEIIYSKVIPFGIIVDRLGSTMHRSVTKKAASKLQLWYRRKKLQSYPPEFTTKNTMIRYYLVKYKIEWLKNLPKKMIRKCNLDIEIEDNRFLDMVPTSHIVREVSYFLRKYASMDIIMWYGW